MSDNKTMTKIPSHKKGKRSGAFYRKVRKEIEIVTQSAQNKILKIQKHPIQTITLMSEVSPYLPLSSLSSPQLQTACDSGISRSCSFNEIIESNVVAPGMHSMFKFREANEIKSHRLLIFYRKYPNE